MEGGAGILRDKMKLLIALVGIYCATACLVVADSDATGNRKQGAAPAPDTTEIVLLGTLHHRHQENKAYSVDILRAIIVALKPSAILVEMPPTIGGLQTVKNDRIPKQFAGNENTVANQAADILRVRLIPYDRKGRNENYKATGYFDREKKAYRHLDGWIEEQTNEEPESVKALTMRVLYASAIGSQAYLNRHAGPAIINSPAHDEIIRNKKCIQHKIVPKLLAASGRQELAREFLFFCDEWETRNQIMAENIVEIAKKHVGKRLVVLCGTEHRYILRDLLDKSNRILLNEFYEVPEWTASGIESRMAGEAKGQGQTMREQETGELDAPADADKPCR